eukprot:7383158-Prymnesium_polylepis.3
MEAMPRTPRTPRTRLSILQCATRCAMTVVLRADMLFGREGLIAAASHCRRTLDLLCTLTSESSRPSMASASTRM